MKFIRCLVFSFLIFREGTNLHVGWRHPQNLCQIERSLSTRGEHSILQVPFMRGLSDTLAFGEKCHEIITHALIDSCMLFSIAILF